MIIAHLLYFPILLGAFKYPRQAVMLSVLTGVLYLIVFALFILPESLLQIVPAMTQFYVYISITVVISSLSMKMQMNEQRYRNVFDNSGNGICVLDGDTGMIIEQNEQCRNLMEAIPGCSHSGFASFCRDDAEMKAFLDHMRHETYVQNHEISRTLADGKEKHLLLFASRLPDGNVAVNIADITERKGAERRIAEREELFHFLADNMVDPSVIYDAEGTILFGNKAAVTVSGLGSVAELKQKNLRNFLFSGTPFQMHPPSESEIVDENGTFQGVFEIQTFNGRTLSVEGRGKRISFHGELATIVTFRDVTLQKRAEFRTCIQRDLGVALASISSVTRASELSVGAAMKVAGLDRGGLYLIDKRTGDFILASSGAGAPVTESLPLFFSADSEVGEIILRGEPCYSECVFPKSGDAFRQTGGGLRTVGCIPIMDRESVIGCFTVGSYEPDDIPLESRTELETIAAQVGNAIARIQAEVSSGESRKNLQMLFDSLEDFLFVCDERGLILHTNPVVAKRLGYSADELQMMAIPEVHPVWARDEVTAVVAEMMAGISDFCRLPLMTKDGEEIPVETKVTLGVWGGQAALFGISRDISERKRAEEALRRRDAILDAVSFSAGHFLGDTAWDTHLSDVMQRLGEATGSSRAYVFQNYIDTESGLLRTKNYGFWTADGIASLPNGDRLRDVCYADGFARWEASLSAGVPLSGNVRDFPECERTYFEPWGIRSFMVVPIFTDSQWWGFIGFYDCVHDREWTRTEIDALQAAAGIIGAAIHRDEVDEVFRDPVEKSLVCTYIVQDGILRYINPRGAEMFGYEREALIDSQYSLLVHAEDLPVVEGHIRERLSGKADSAHYEFRGIKKSGDEIVCEVYGTPISYMGGTAIVGTLMDITERKAAEERVEHLHQVILAVRNVNELIVREKNRDRLVQQVCKTLTETRGYYRAAIHLFDGEGGVICRTSEQGYDDAFIQQAKQMRRTDLAVSCNEVLSSSDVFIFEDPCPVCVDPVISRHPDGYGQMCVRLEHEGDVYGLLSISLPRDLASDAEEKAIFVEVADDIGFALHSIALEEERRDAEKELKIKDYAISSAISGVVIFDLNGNVTYANDAAVEMWGYESPAEMPGRGMDELLVLREQGADLLSGLYETGVFVGEIEAKKKDGSSFIGQAHASDIIDDQGWPVCLMASVVDVTETKRAEEALYYSETLYRTIFGTSGTALALVEEDGLISLGNLTLEKLFGYPLGEVEGKLKWDVFVAENDREGVRNYFAEADRDAGGRSHQYEAELCDKWGKLRQCYISIDLIPGTKRHVLSFTDITELKDYETQIKDSLDEKSVLLMEIHHRVKNNLQIISGLIKLQALSMGDDDAVVHLKECENRIMTMALVHESLYQSENLAFIHAREHLQRLASNILRSETDTSHISLNVLVDDISLNLDTAIPCSLIVNELLTNSVKYAFDGDKNGIITVELHRDDDDLLTLIIADDGRGLPPDFDIYTANSLGLKLVARLLRSQLKGTLEVDGENGAKFTMKFPEKKKS
ncbi:PAS domain S-box protein [Methanogenium sp. S4BF]|uniref:PAS domain S-box protein n=1 Tax=Methanogenium sp. S4BF TaxID=1789226 RepID=UPI002415CA10|nr:PAS domain S-box protein [Methanogenium sp. S4BF]WFN35564.1 PAS domain S-box protein [Methanogenium sp. S4BF]